MRWVRSTWLGRCVAIVLVGTMAPAVLTPTSASASNLLTRSYAEWIRSQLLVSDDPVVNRALDEAAEAGGTTFESFVEAFLDAYEARYPAVPAARIFTDRNLSNQALIGYLQRRYTGIAPEAVPPRLRLVGTSSHPSHVAGGDAAVSVYARSPSRTSLGIVAAPQTDMAVASLRPTTPARPQGP